jgi:hypothetical protein
MIFCVVVVVVAVSGVDGRYFAARKIRVFCGAFRAFFTTENTENTEGRGHKKPAKLRIVERRGGYDAWS